MRALAPRTDQPRSTRRRILEALLGLMTAGIVAFLVFDPWFGFRETANRHLAYARQEGGAEDYARTRNALRFRIGVLLKPREGTGNIGGDRTGPLIQAGLLYGRLALLEERHGDRQASSRYMAEGVSLLKSAGHPRPNRDEIRRVIALHDSRGSTGKPPRP